jgi:phospholipase C
MRDADDAAHSVVKSRGGPLSRRQFLASAAAGAGLLRFPDLTSSARPGGAALAARLPKPAASGIEHVVLVMMENRSFDHLLGWLPGANGRQGGLVYTDASGVQHATYPLTPDYQGCGHPDPDHSYEGGRVEYDNGACDGWLRAGSNDAYCVGYYGQSDLAFLGNLAPQWTAFDNYFAAIMAETQPNRMYQHAAQTDRLHKSTTISTLPTIWDRLAQSGLTGRYYYSDVPFLALWGTKYLSIGRPFAQFLTNCAAGTLPHVSYIDPRFLGENRGTSGDDHPHADIRNGEVFLNTIYNAVTSSPRWPNTLLVINYDEWGGFFDHVPPKAAPIPPADRAAGNQDGLRGFRVPSLVVSPWSRRGSVSHTLYDHTSVLKLIEWRWKLAPLTVRDATANNLAGALDFRRPNLAVPRADVPPGPFGGPCGVSAAGASPRQEWTRLQTLAGSYGWTV